MCNFPYKLTYFLVNTKIIAKNRGDLRRIAEKTYSAEITKSNNG